MTDWQSDLLAREPQPDHLRLAEDALLESYMQHWDALEADSAALRCEVKRMRESATWRQIEALRRELWWAWMAAAVLLVVVGILVAKGI